MNHCAFSATTITKFFPLLTKIQLGLEHLAIMYFPVALEHRDVLHYWQDKST
jgi:hypothetical protein